ncbi:MAG: hypothetical protein WD895_05185 [Acidimicrobiia bacterium]
MDREFEFKKQVHQHYDALQLAYDRVVLTLAGGALALSMTFISQIAPAAIDTWKLAWGWGLLLGSLLFVAISYIPSIRAHRRELDGKTHKALDLIADGLRMAAGPLLVSGYGYLAWFAFTNLTNGIE